MEGETVDWVELRGELIELARLRLGKRSPKFEDALAAAEPSEAGLLAAVREASQIRITFLDPVWQAQVAYELEALIATFTGREPPPAPGFDPLGDMTDPNDLV